MPPAPTARCAPIAGTANSRQSPPGQDGMGSDPGYGPTGLGGPGREARRCPRGLQGSRGDIHGQRAAWGTQGPRGFLWGGKRPGHRVAVAGSMDVPTTRGVLNTRARPDQGRRQPQEAGPHHPPACFPIDTALGCFLSAAGVQPGTWGQPQGRPRLDPCSASRPLLLNPPACGPRRRFSTACPATDTVPGKDVTAAHTAQPHCTDGNTRPRETTAASAAERCYRWENRGPGSTLPEGEPQAAKPRRGVRPGPGEAQGARQPGLLPSDPSPPHKGHLR